MGKNRWIPLEKTDTKQNVCSICCSDKNLYVLSLDGKIVKIELRPESQTHDFVLCSTCIKRIRKAEIWKEK